MSFHPLHALPGLGTFDLCYVCPSSRVMSLEQWLPGLAARQKTSPTQLLITPFMAPAKGTGTQQVTGECAEFYGCYPEWVVDDIWMCVCN